MKTIHSILVNVIFLGQVYSQGFTLSGVVTDTENGQAVHGVNIFMSGTTLGTVSGIEGEFKIDGLPGKSAELIFSHVSYETLITTFANSAEETRIEIKLKPSTYELPEVTVEEKPDKEWKRNMKKFTAAFLGKTSNANNCEIENPWIVDLAKIGIKLEARAHDMIMIRNDALGYRIHFLLTHFSMEGESVSYSGKYRFEELTTENESQIHKWAKSRSKTYYGSLRHFLHSLSREELNNDGFIIHLAKLNSSSTGFEIGVPVRGSDVTNKKNPDGSKEIDFKDFIRVIYTKGHQKSDPDSRSLSGRDLPSLPSSSEVESHLMIDSENYQTSYIFLIKRPITLSPDGSSPDREYIKEYGFWANNRVAELLPLEYSPSEF
jgi:hypothetical protein